ncbi:MAG: FAD-dependent thymidylate synthase [Candidatus Micrarchaeota archaeon]
MDVELIAHTPDPDITAAAAAMTSTSKRSTIQIIRDSKEPEMRKKALKVLKRVMASGHLSVLEHTTFTFSVSGVSRALTHELVRHRIASYTQQSQRYVKFENEKDFIHPHTIEKNKKTKGIYERLLSESIKAYDELVGEGIPFEDARYVLPNASPTNIIITMNARALLNFFSLRCCERAQWEIRELATEMCRQVKRLAPVMFADAGPSCSQKGRCTEGKLTCGRMGEVVERFNNL